jgi:putative transposase
MKRPTTKGYKYRAYPSDEEVSYLMQCFGARRKMYNLHVEKMRSYIELKGLKPCDRIVYKDMGMPTVSEFKKEATGKNGELFLYDVDSYACCEAKRDFVKAVAKYNKSAYKKQFKRSALKREKKEGIPPGFLDQKGIPDYKSRKRSDFTYTTYHAKYERGVLYLPPGKNSRGKCHAIPLHMHRPLPETFKLNNVTVTMNARGQIYVALNIEYEIEIPDIAEVTKVLGIDYSQSDFFVDSSGRRANAPLYLKKRMAKLKKEQKKLSLMARGSGRYEKQRMRVAKLHLAVSNQRKDWLHKKSYAIAEKYDVVVVEGLDLRSLAASPYYAKKLHDNGFGYFRLMLGYKLADRGKVFLKSGKYFPSTQVCNMCGVPNTMLKGDVKTRMWMCPECGKQHDRDINSALNLMKYGYGKNGVRSVPRQTVGPERRIVQPAGQEVCIGPLIPEAYASQAPGFSLG